MREYCGLGCETETYVRVVIVAATVCARTHGHDVARLSKLIINLSQSRGHLIIRRRS